MLRTIAAFDHTKGEKSWEIPNGETPANIKNNPALAGVNIGRTGRNGTPVAIVQEDVVNTYSVSDAYNAAPGDDYWAATKDYWAAIRAKWDEVIVRDGGIYVEEAADTGAVTGTPLMELAEKVQKREITEAAAIEQGRSIIETATRR